MRCASPLFMIGNSDRELRASWLALSTSDACRPTSSAQQLHVDAFE
jgi:hypothetical protein